MSYFPGVAEKIPAVCLPWWRRQHVVSLRCCNWISFQGSHYRGGVGWVPGAEGAEPQSCPFRFQDKSDSIWEIFSVMGSVAADRLQLCKHEVSLSHRGFTQRLCSFAINSSGVSNGFWSRRSIWEKHIP